MARGFLSGLIWGSVLSVGGAAVVSMSTPLPQAPAVASDQLEVREPTVSTAPAPLPEPPASATDSTTEQPASPAAPETDTLAALDEADTTPVAAPTVGAAEPLAETTDPEVKPPSVAVSTETAPVVVAENTTPTAPEVSEELRISTEPAQPAPPPSVEETSGFGEDEAAEPEETAEPVATVEPAETVQAAQTPEPAETGAAVETVESVETPEPAPEAAETAPETEIAAVDEQNAATEEQPSQAAPEPRVSNLPRVEPEAPADPEDDPTATNEAPGTAPSPSIGQRVAPITERGTAVTTLPTVGAATAEPEEAPATTPSEQAPTAPIEQFAAPFNNPDGKPLMGIVLIDDENSIGSEALETFPYPLTFAINPFDPNAEEKMNRYRAAGFEVLALLDLPLDAAPEDAEATLEVAMSTMGEAIGVLEGIGSGVQGSRPLSDQVTAILRDKGYGFITQNSGLNTVQKLAEREGVPSAFVFRDFDGANQTPTVMRRFLDQAAFRAGQEGGVIMLGRVRPDTVSALLLWGLQDRASRVALAPASAVLMQQPEAE